MNMFIEYEITKYNCFNMIDFTCQLKNKNKLNNFYDTYTTFQIVRI